MPEYVERSYHEALVNALAHRDYLVNGSEVHIDIYDDRMENYSLGGMPDGSYIQERDPVAVPSTRRNPVLADVFNRLGYMERKGSGFGKIIGGYEFQINYSEGKKTSFRSDRYQFTVIMPNLNYGVDNTNGIKDTIHDTIDTNRDTNGLEIRLVDCINENADFTQKVYAEMLNVSVPTIKRLFARLQKENVLKREGTNRKGRWIVIEKDQMEK